MIREEHFSILWPPLLRGLLILKVRRLWILGLLLLGIASASVIRVLLWQSFGRDVWPRLYYGLDTRMDSLLLGCLIGLLAAWQLLPQRGWLLTASWYAGALRHFTTAYASGSMWSRASCHPSMRPSSSTATPSSLAAPYAPAVAAGPAATATAG
jgi:peptidoglycan/LPS O-acetylase OafA/YrhL